MKIYYFLLIIAALLGIGGFFIFTDISTEKNQSELTIGNAPKSEQSIKEEKSNSKLDEKVLMGYVQDFRDPSSIDYSQLTHAIFSFAHPQKDGSLELNGEEAKANLRNMVKEAHQEDTKAMLAVGGAEHLEGGGTYDYFKAAIYNPKSRAKLIDELIEISNEENLDGIDIDFEHPRTQKDAQYLAEFTEKLGEKLRASDKELSIAVFSKIDSETGKEVPSVIYEPAMFHHVNHVNVMAYDGHWSGEYKAENLSPYPFTEKIVSYWSDLFNTHNISRGKLVLGVPFYGQPEDAKGSQISYSNIISQDPANALRDKADIDGKVYHYNGEKTMRKKTELAHHNGFGGMMIWELGHDSKGEHSLTSAIYDVQKMKRFK
ncbi:glycosyl hydrolase family 18 protein [Alteribacillus sp. HJP-4]|uniref:glycosyl hydrolase family 18 protein n=1 Tax=Alteribacillus sp. HJP-4 TaxID=2775394 RepID=UPI0035CCE4C3